MGNIETIHGTNYDNKQYRNGLSVAPIGLALLVITLSLSAIAIVYTSFGHLPGYGTKPKKIKTTISFTA
jgi:hypothetical protein